MENTGAATKPPAAQALFERQRKLQEMAEKKRAAATAGVGKEETSGAPPEPKQEPKPEPSTTNERELPTVWQVISSFQWPLGHQIVEFYEGQLLSDAAVIEQLRAGTAPIAPLDDVQWIDCPNCAHRFPIQE